MSISVRYPNQFELVRLEALGDPPYLEVDAARQRYDSGQSIRVVSEGQPPAWFLIVSPKRHRFTATYYAASGTPIREAMWEQDAGSLLCRRTIDLFYPDGDLGRRVPYTDIVSVTQQVSADGVVGVTLSSPIGDDDFREVTDVPLNDLRLAVPAFGAWESVIEASAPPALERFGQDSLDAAIAHAETCVVGETRLDSDEAGTRSAGWRLPAGSREVLGAVDAIVEATSKSVDIPVLSRGAARVLPLALQASSLTSGRTPSEEHRRMTVLAAEIRDGCEHRAGQGILFDLDTMGEDSVASYASALRDAGAARAEYWAYGSDHGVVLVWTGDETEGSLALHIVPVSWISERRAQQAIDGIDVRWSLSDVVGQHDAPDSLGLGREERQSS